MRALALVTILLLALAAPHARADADEDRAQRALDWLLARDFVGVGPAYAAQAATAAGLDPGAWPGRGPLLDRIAISTDRTDQAYKALLQSTYAVGVAGHDPRGFRGHDLVSLVRAGFDGAEFGEPQYINDDIFAILALRAAGVPPGDDMIQRSAAFVLASRGPDGGWGYSTLAVGSLTDTTGMALAALASAGFDVRGDQRAAAFFETTRDASGGFRESKNRDVNLQSTLWALHGRHALGLPEDLAAEAYVRSRQLAQGSFSTGKAAEPGPNAWATTEAALYLAGGRHPLPGWADPGIGLTPALPGSPSALRVGAAFRTATWTLGGATLEGARVEHAFPRWGDHPFTVHAVGDRVHARASGLISIPSLPPVARLAQAQVETDRHALVRPDLSASTDPDGVVTLAEVAWGDGIVDTARPDALGHAYDLPGNHTVTLRVRDDAGVWSAPVAMRVHVRDRAPQVALPERLTADRVSELVVPVAASDPDGDAWRLRWWVDDVTGEGAPRLRFATLGARTLRVEAVDPYGLRGEATTTIEVVDLAPEILSAEALVGPWGDVELVAAATDADGPPPAIRWSVDGALLEGATTRVGPGAHLAEAVATDADGVSTRRVVAFVVGEPRPVARVERMEARFEAGDLVVDYATSPSDAVVRIGWETEGASGTLVATGSPARIPFADATWARVRVAATLGETEASAERTALRRGASSAAPPLLLEASTGRAWTGETVALQAAAPGAVAYRFDFGDGNATAWSSDPLASHAYARAGIYALVAQARGPSGAIASAGGTILIEGVRERVGEGGDGAEEKEEGNAPDALIPAIPTSPAPEALQASRSQVPGPPLVLALALALVAMRHTRRARE